jgi:BirA family biotin operon repressor/biotin-[acetyl-CoA-carboxylase] ligase
LRWPNDLILKCRKLGGLLIEVRTEGQNKRSIILGMGINVNQKKFPGDLDRSATSLLIQLNKRISRKKLAIKILEELDNMISYIKERQMNNVLQEWKFYSYEIGRNIKIETGSGIEKSGKVLGIGENGELIIVDNNGRIARIFNGYNLRLSDS